MKVEMEKLEGNRIRLDIEVEKEKVDDALEKAYRKVVGEVKIPGFRKGKVPRKVLEARLGEEVLYQDAIEILVPPVLGEALQEKEIEPIDQPNLEDIHFQTGEPAKLQVLVEVEPEVELGKYTGLEVEKQEVAIEQDDVDEVLEQYREQQATLVGSDREEVQDGDFVVIDFEGFLDGDPFEGGKGEDYTLGIGTKTFIPGFEEQLIGAKVGEEKEIQVTFPEDYQEEALAGKEVTFKVQVKEIKERELPPLDDELAQTVGEYENLEELKKEIEENMRHRAANETQAKFENEVMEAIAQDVKVDVPEKLVEQRMDDMFKEADANIQQKGFKLEDYLQMTGVSKEDWMEENRPYAEKQVRNRLIIDAITDKEGFTVSDEEIEERMDEIVGESEHDPEQFKTILKAQGYDKLLEKDMLREKVLNFLWEKNKKQGEEEKEEDQE